MFSQKNITKKNVSYATLPSRGYERRIHLSWMTLCVFYDAKNPFCPVEFAHKTRASFIVLLVPMT